MNNYQEIQLFFLESVAMFCVFLAGYLVLTITYNINRKYVLIVLELATAALLICDIFASTNNGVEGLKARQYLTICMFGIFVLIQVIALAFCFYIKTWLNLNTDKKALFCLKMSGAISNIGIVMLIASQIIHFYYSFDDNNKYHLEGLYRWMYLFPMISILLIFGVTVCKIQQISKKVVVSIFLFEVSTILALLYSIKDKGTVFINIAICFNVIVLFFVTVIDEEDAIKKASTTHPRTGLLNSYGYFRWIAKIKRKEHLKDYNAYYFELKDYSSYNRKYGSDIVLRMQQRYHKILFDNINSNEIIANLGGDYYVCLIRKENTTKFLNLMKGVDIEISFNGRKINEVFSSVVGAYSIENDDILSEEIMANTAIAIGMARNAGGKEVVFIDDSLKQRMLEKREIEKRIPIAMEKGEFVPFYQPKVAASTKNLNGAEALVRWKRGADAIPPGKFIPLMEENGKICELDFYMLNRVCEDIAEWISKGLNPPKISVNFSRKNLANKNLVNDITNIIDSHKIPHELIEIEITETLDEHPMEVMVKLVERLHNKNISVAIDDFGTGSSSMNLLRAVDFDMIKIDKSFVNRANERDQKILTRIVTIANDISVGIIAEGVETQEQLKRLTNLGCDNIQGFLFDKPLPKDEFIKRIKDGVYW